MVKVALLGSSGNIGRRYQAVLRHLDIEHTCYDIVDHPLDVIEEGLLFNCYTHIIIATPTNTHYGWLSWFNEYTTIARILCEKPLSTSLQEVEVICNSSLDLTMVCNYKYALKRSSRFAGRPATKNTSYSFYNHGGDGLAWDCIQLIGLAEGDIQLSEDTPIWECRINGYKILKDSIDYTYIDMIREWVPGKDVQNKDDLLDMHKKTHYLQGLVNNGKYQSVDWDSNKD